MGAAVLHLLHQSGGLLGLPEVIERELLKHCVQAGVDAVAQVQARLSDLQRIVGSVPHVELPTEEQLQEHVKARLDELQSLIRRVPFSLEHALRALDRVDAGTPPNGPKNQQYKDSAIWEAVLELGAGFPVLFVSSDRGFFEGREVQRGSARILRDEVEQAGVSVEIVANLSAAAAKLRDVAPPLNRPALARAAGIAVRATLAENVGNDGFEPGELIEWTVEPFATEIVGVLSVAFQLSFQLIDAAAEERTGRTDAKASVEGSCSLSGGAVYDVRVSKIQSQWVNPDGSQGRGGVVMAMAGTAYLGGRPPIPLNIRVPVD
jgi:hypothetical protein